MKKWGTIVGFMCLGLGLFATQVYAESDLDTIYNDGIVEEFFQQESIPSELETLAFEGGVVSEEGFIPEIPKDALFVSDKESGVSSMDPRSIIGSDNRKIVSNTTLDPYKKVAFLVITYPNGKSYIGTGNLVSSDTVLTAGHCIYSKENGGFAKSVTVYPGYNGNYAPYGVAYSKKLMSVRGWTENGNSQHDIGAIKLDRNIGNSVGWFGLTTVMNSPITLSGYHGDLNKKMGTETENILRTTANNVYYKLDSTGGSSGSGVYNNNKQILSVHAYGAGSENFGTRINEEKFYVVRSWITSLPLVPPSTQGVNYNSHLMDLGWIGNVANGSVSGTVGQKRRMEAIKISINNLGHIGGSIQYRSHVQDKGWMNWVSNGAVSGTTGQKKRMEAIQIKLTGEIAKVYNVEYRAHVSNKGWLPWVQNGQTAGTTGEARQMEAIQIRLVKK
ncbi:trypsin-like serine protease [Enterococcus quebecensis]|uniref:Serine protease n=1 Tax=Enterococcus quebecensis TaxID=903983 RepID=A0A1E5H370_9ENTE|nr:trypsin-like serine protease [Enterococcus quebecensis]OEG19332.1 peptidase S1 [Enterococcus quebecensis]OJG75751.1 S1 family extracellular protease [Enterococcus quebecensis]